MLLGVPCVTCGRVGTVGCSKAEDTPGLSQDCFPVGLLVSHHGKAPSSHAARGKGAVKLGFSPVKSSWTLPSTGGESWGCYGCGARPSDPCVGTHIKDQGHMSIIKPGDIRVDVLGISKVKQQGGRWREVRRVGEKKKQNKIGKKKNKLSSHFWKRNRRGTKETTQKQSQEGGVCLVFGNGIPCFGFTLLPCAWWEFTSGTSKLDWYLFLCTRLF